MDNGESCGLCGGDGFIANAFGSRTKCPGCHGSGRRGEDSGLRDVTKTKPSHFAKSPAAAAKPQWPTTFEGIRLATEVRDSKSMSLESKAKLTREIMDHEDTHGTCTQTFQKKVRRQLRPALV
jgi:hypothetical protein